jgi:hypothetical protein
MRKQRAAAMAGELDDQADAQVPALSIFSYSKSGARPLHLALGINNNHCLPTPARGYG